MEINFLGKTGLDHLISKLKGAFASKSQGSKADTAVQSVKIGTTEYKSGTNVVLPDYPTTLPASDVSEWAKSSTKPLYTKSEIGLGNVENKSSATIRGEITKSNVASALGYTPYTPNEIDNKFSTLETNIDWKESVDTYDDIETTYPNPQDGWTVNVKDTDYTYRYNGTSWVAISANAIPKATNSVDGLLSKEDHTNYEDANSKKHTHSNKSVIDGITSTLVSNWNSAKTHANSAHAPSNAEANQNAFSNITVGSTTVSADTKTDTLTLVGSNVTLTPDATNDKVTIGITKANVTSALGYTPPTTDTVYVHPSYTAKTSGLYKVTVDSTGHVSDATAVTKSDITALGIPSSDTNTHYTSKNVVGSSTATANTTSALTNGNVYLNSVENGAITSSHKITGSGATTVTTDASGNIVVTSTDTNTNTTYSAGTGISLSGTTFSNSGVRSIAPGTTNGTISVNTNGTVANVSVYGLGTAAFTASTAYATSSHTHSYLPLAGGTMTGQIQKAGASCSWYQGRSNAMVRTTSSGSNSSYCPIFSVKSYEGSWDVGTYANNRLHFSYITDANFNAGTNTQTADIYMGIDGSVTANTFIGELSGNATTATALTSSAGSSTQPIYFSSGKPVACTYTLGASVPSGAKFTDTTYSAATTSSSGLMSAADKTKLDGIASGANAYTLPTASSSTLGGVKTTSNVTSSSGLTACPIISGVPYYKDTNTTYTLSSFGLTATSTELNYCDGVTSNIQTQLNSKAPTSHASSSTTYGISSSSNYGHAKASSTTPKANGTAATGSETATFARGDHVHPVQTSVTGNAGTSTKLATMRYIDGIGFDGSADIDHFVVCDTASGTAEKTVTVNNFKLFQGAKLVVLFANANTASNPTLNVNGTGAKAINYKGSAIPSGYIKAGTVLELAFTGSYSWWEVVGDITQYQFDSLNSTVNTLSTKANTLSTDLGLIKSPTALYSSTTGIYASAMQTWAYTTVSGLSSYKEVRMWVEVGDGTRAYYTFTRNNKQISVSAYVGATYYGCAQVLCDFDNNRVGVYVTAKNGWGLSNIRVTRVEGLIKN